MPIDPTQDPSFYIDDPFGESPNKYGGGGGGRIGGSITPNPGPMFGFGLGSGPGFGAGAATGMRRRLGAPLAAVPASARNRYASPLGSLPGRPGNFGRGSFGPARQVAPGEGGYASGGGLPDWYNQRFTEGGRGAADPVGTGNYLTDWFQQQAGGANGSDYALLGALGLAGGFDPMGSPALIEALRRQAMQSSQANEASARTQAMLTAGNDPLMQAQAALGARLGGADAQNRSLLAARSQSALQNQKALQDFALALQLGARGTMNQGALTELQGRWNSKIANESKGGVGDFFGGLAGTALGGWAGSGFAKPFG